MKVNPGKILSLIVFLIFTACIFIYLPCDIYNFQPPKKFAGNFLYNPYKDSSADWQQSNFHAHAMAWDRITNGKQKAADILNLYQQKGYNYASISNYENISAADKKSNAINVYEHGYNLRKVHQLAIMPQQVCYRDFPLIQFTSAKQFILNKLSENCKAVVIAHPLIKKGYSDEDFKKLTGYNCIEVLNHSVNSSNKWDVALSAGKPVWIAGDDDTHNMLDTGQTFTNWTMIDCHQHNKDSLIYNLINGNAYAVNGKNAININKLRYVDVNGMNMYIRLQHNADSIQLIGQNGIMKKVYFNTNNAAYTFLDNDTYIRAVIYNKGCHLYLNPVLRYNGAAKPQNALTASVNVFDTFLYRSCLLFCWLAVFVILKLNAIKAFIKLLRYRWYQSRNSPKLSI